VQDAFHRPFGQTTRFDAMNWLPMIDL